MPNVLTIRRVLLRPGRVGTVYLFRDEFGALYYYLEEEFVGVTYLLREEWDW